MYKQVAWPQELDSRSATDFGQPHSGPSYIKIQVGSSSCLTHIPKFAQMDDSFLYPFAPWQCWSGFEFSWGYIRLKIEKGEKGNCWFICIWRETRRVERKMGYFFKCQFCTRQHGLSSLSPPRTRKSRLRQHHCTTFVLALREPKMSKETFITIQHKTRRWL